jgi:hypothetical protein
VFSEAFFKADRTDKLSVMMQKSSMFSARRKISLHASHIPNASALNIEHFPTILKLLFSEKSPKNTPSLDISSVFDQSVNILVMFGGYFDGYSD